MIGTNLTERCKQAILETLLCDLLSFETRWFFVRWNFKGKERQTNSFCSSVDEGFSKVLYGCAGQISNVSIKIVAALSCFKDVLEQQGFKRSADGYFTKTVKMENYCPGKNGDSLEWQITIPQHLAKEKSPLCSHTEDFLQEHILFDRNLLCNIAAFSAFKEASNTYLCVLRWWANEIARPEYIRKVLRFPLGTNYAFQPAEAFIKSAQARKIRYDKRVELQLVRNSPTTWFSASNENLSDDVAISINKVLLVNVYICDLYSTEQKRRDIWKRNTVQICFCFLMYYLRFSGKSFLVRFIPKELFLFFLAYFSVISTISIVLCIYSDPWFPFGSANYLG